MRASKIAGERLVALFLFGVLILNPPFLLISDKPTVIAGIPVLFVHLFAAWAALIALLAMATGLPRYDSDDDPRAVERDAVRLNSEPDEGN